jgi:hypothetical protein
MAPTAMTGARHRSIHHGWTAAVSFLAERVVPYDRGWNHDRADSGPRPHPRRGQRGTVPRLCTGPTNYMIVVLLLLLPLRLM